MSSATFVDRGVDPPIGDFDDYEKCLACDGEIKWTSWGPIPHVVCDKRLAELVCCGVQWGWQSDECGSCGREFPEW